MPYDFEIPKSKIIIEVQGNQHLQYIQHFHGSYENFEYQQLKDRMKKEFAENKGYTVIYITYDMFKDNKYKEFLNQQLFQNTHTIRPHNFYINNKDNSKGIMNYGIISQRRKI